MGFHHLSKTAGLKITQDITNGFKLFQKGKRLSKSQEAAEGRTAHNNGWNGVNGMISTTLKPRVCVWYHSMYSVPAYTMSPQIMCNKPPVNEIQVDVAVCLGWFNTINKHARLLSSVLPLLNDDTCYHSEDLTLCLLLIIEVVRRTYLNEGNIPYLGWWCVY